MIIKSSTFFRQLAFFTIFQFIFLSLFCISSFSQTDTKNKKFLFETIAALKEEARPRLVEEKKVKEEKPKNVEKLNNSNSTIALVTTVALINELERKAFEITNQKRKENGLPPIVWSEDMAKVARLHSESMARYKYFSHAGLDGSMVNDRADSLGFSNWRAIGENIAYNRGYENPVEFACQRWMQSQSHRENILNPRWKEAGIGVAITEEGTYYFTQVFLLKK